MHFVVRPSLKNVSTELDQIFKDHSGQHADDYVIHEVEIKPIIPWMWDFKDLKISVCTLGKNQQ